MNDPIALARVLAVLHETLAGVAAELSPIPAGFVARTRSLPDIWTLNQVNVTGSVSADELVALTEEHQADLRFRHVVIDDEVVGAGLRAPLSALGWAVAREVYMVLDSAVRPRVVDTAGVVDLTTAEMVDLVLQWLVEEGRGGHPGVLDQVADYNRLEGRLWDEFPLGVRDASGAPVALTKLRIREEIAWVEDVYTVPAARGAGHARALVTRAVELAGAPSARFTFIVADDEDWPKNLYASIGFVPVGIGHTFHLDRGQVAGGTP